MALLTQDGTYIVTFASPTSAAWQALSPAPGYPTGFLSDAITNGGQLAIYVYDAPSGSFSFRGGQATGFDDTIVTAIAGPLSANTFSDVDATLPLQFMKDAAGAVYVLNPSTGTIAAYDVGPVAALKAWLP